MVLGVLACGAESENNNSGTNNMGSENSSENGSPNNQVAEDQLTVELDGQSLSYANVSRTCMVGASGDGLNFLVFVDASELYFAQFSIIGGDPEDFSALLNDADLPASSVTVGGQVQYQALGDGGRQFLGGRQCRVSAIEYVSRCWEPRNPVWLHQHSVHHDRGRHQRHCRHGYCQRSQRNVQLFDRIKLIPELS